jgi:hypothetical protein
MFTCVVNQMISNKFGLNLETVFSYNRNPNGIRLNKFASLLCPTVSDEEKKLCQNDLIL